MVYRIEWSPEALDNIDEIASFIKKDSPAYAGIVVRKIRESVMNLRFMPYTGRIVPEVGDSDLREAFVYSYRIIYKIEPNRIVIETVFHGMRLL